ncbi:cytochrome c family protein [Pararhodobacter sp. CCB-MM2]|uniref:c-type cytochrome n=1 Tax=Pararhodobacter sp. CCB-MM2 TaxID=1786003 RepID=UPI00082A8C55|nr:c-type cytochrome [Pararhodobacter sp. CCB-MM2]MCA2011611.1 c-type cytochrome [Cereibacter sphaeroides]
MFDTMVITKAVGAICATFLFFLVGKWAAETIYMPAHGDHAAAVYPLPTEGDDHGAAEAAPAEEIDVDALYASADAAAGEALWRNCRSCHSLEGANGTGPHLDGVVGRAIDAVDGFNYSGALLQVGDTWTVENLFHFLEDPRSAAPGTRMSFRGLRDPQDRVNLIKYLEEHPA